MALFSKDFIDFFRELEKNNHKDWFDQNRKRYEKSVKDPFTNFVGEMINAIGSVEPQFEVQPKDCILRINRDIRFSKDKTPYNTHFTAFISRGGRKDKSLPGFFVRFGADEIGIMGGCFGPSKEQLQALRQHITQNSKELHSILNTPAFKDTYGELKGEVSKRMPAEFAEAVKEEPLVANKQFYFSTRLPGKIILDDHLIDIMMEHWHAMRDMNQFLENALKS